MTRLNSVIEEYRGGSVRSKAALPKSTAGCSSPKPAALVVALHRPAETAGAEHGFADLKIAVGNGNLFHGLVFLDVSPSDVF